MRPRLRADAWEDYAHGTRGDHYAWWCRTELTLGESQWSGKPFVLESEWQLPIMCEALAVDAAGDPYWRTVVLVVPRKNAKTATLGAYADYSADNDAGEPEILLAAGSDKQAGRLFAAASGFIRRSESLSERLLVREYIGEISRVDGAGKILRLSSEGDTQHGLNPSKVIIDELHVWRTPKLRRSWGALTTADGARAESQVFCITTEGEAQGRAESILGQLVDANEASGELERLPGLVVSRDHDSRVIVFRFHAVDAAAADPRPLRAALSDAKAGKKPESDAEGLERALLDSVMPANPASWITEAYISRQARSSKVMAGDFLQLHACIAAESRDVWIPGDAWERCEDTSLELEAGTEICVAVDASISHDSTAVAWTTRLADGRVAGWAHVWSARAESPADELVEGGRIRFGAVEAFITDVLAKRYRVREVVYDPQFFEQSAQNLSDAGLLVAPMVQSSGMMRGAEQAFHDAVLEQRFAHSGAAVLRAHVAATVAERSNGGWKIRKAKQSAVIDATVAMVMAHDRAARIPESVYESRGLLTI